MRGRWWILHAAYVAATCLGIVCLLVFSLSKSRTAPPLALLARSVYLSGYFLFPAIEAWRGWLRHRGQPPTRRRDGDLAIAWVSGANAVLLLAYIGAGDAPWMAY